MRFTQDGFVVTANPRVGMDSARIRELYRVEPRKVFVVSATLLAVLTSACSGVGHAPRRTFIGILFQWYSKNALDNAIASFLEPAKMTGKPRAIMELTAPVTVAGDFVRRISGVKHS